MNVPDLIDGLRREAEGALASVKTTLTTAYGRSAVAKVVQAFYNALSAAGSQLGRMQPAIIAAHAANPTPQTADALERTNRLMMYWTALAQGFTTYVRPATQDERSGADAIGVAPVVVAVVVVAVVGSASVVAVSLTGVAWAVVHYEQATALQKEIDLLAANPAMAEALIRLNQSNPGGPGPGNGPGTATIVAVGLGILGALGAGYLYFKKG